MLLNCPSCGSGDARRAHRRLFDRVLSVFNWFPCWCGECGERFFARAGRDEHRKRRLLRELACPSPPAQENPSTPEAGVLITVRTVGQTADLVELLNRINGFEQESLPVAAVEAPPTIKIAA